MHLVVLPCRINFYTMIEANDTPTLRVLPGGRRDQRDCDRRAGAAAGPRGSALGSALEECVVSRAAVRAGDRHEPWTLPVGGALAAVADAAATAGVEFELAVRLCAEAALVRDDLRAVGAGVGALDALAGAAVVATRVDASDCAYLRRLTRRGAQERRTLGDAVIVGLPARLSARLLAVDVDDLLANADVESALAWEIAAVLDGRTISEWAPLAALRALATTPSSS
ncbi:hypothetical protein VSS74_22950 [Conexibacter stalactiti]|uniref:Uncharacterized protein n=1 Tax=Conexibacter stalactiti TaxID=1940611 RepID=A0ABU4HWM2_9ACTN|nr:hypothetical protein [Conexibacter stalactiti]MDW5597224.1 hypothetical protein [Conexibacter stalactiti]MEC5037866.1 hypothetical protein [Conexibacter stalactiti]